MTSLPSFVDLMASLGLGQEPIPPQPSHSSPSSPPRSPITTGPRQVPSRCRSHPSLKEHIFSRSSKSPRFSPYSSPAAVSRRGSVSSLPPDHTAVSRALSTSPHNEPLSLRVRRNHRRGLSVSVSETSSSDVLDMPISTYIRRKTPAASPTSSDFSFVSDSSSLDESATPFSLTLPTLPPFFTQIPSCAIGSLPSTPGSDTGLNMPLQTPSPKSRHFLQVEEPPLSRRRRHTGVRISAPAHSPERTNTN